MRKILIPFKSYLLYICLIVTTFACKRDTDPQPNQNQQPSNVEVNNWIYDVMTEVYLWNYTIPRNPDLSQTPEVFFESILYRPTDRFSAIVPDYDALISSLNGVSMEAGYEYIFRRTQPASNDLIAQIIYVKPNSPAQTAGLKRGDIITQINNSAITLSNYQSLNERLSSNHSITYERFNQETESFENKGTIDLTVVELQENPNYLHKIVETPQGTKVGYFVYNFFSDGEDGKNYNNEMDQIISSLKSEGATEFVLDLRYNSGGSVTSANNLGSLLAKGVDENNIFFKYEYNNLIQAEFEKENGGESLIGRFINKPENIGNNLASGKLYILTGSRTASASELIINGLKPYMQVFLIGETTVGKNVGSAPIEDKQNPNNKYGLLPIVLKILNSQNESEYGNGFMPDIEISEFEFPFLRELGDPEEPLLTQALAQIDGIFVRLDRPSKGAYTEPVFYSIDNKAFSNRIIIPNGE